MMLEPQLTALTAKTTSKENMKKNIIFSVLVMLAIAAYFFSMNAYTEKKKQIGLLEEKANAAYQHEWVKFSKQSEFNAFVFETYKPCISGNNNALVCRSASVQLANVLHGELFAKRVNQSILESINSVRADDSISQQLEALRK